MASFYVQPLSANMPLPETLNLCVQNLYRNQTYLGNSTKRFFIASLRLPCAMFESFFIFDENVFE